MNNMINTIKNNGYKVDINKVIILFGSSDIKLSTAMLYVKHYIYLRRNKGLALNIESFKAYIKFNIASQELVSRKNNQIEQIKENWSFLYLFI